MYKSTATEVLWRDYTFAFQFDRLGPPGVAPEQFSQARQGAFNELSSQTEVLKISYGGSSPGHSPVALIFTLYRFAKKYSILIPGGFV
jgi:hypothetical protein